MFPSYEKDVLNRPEFKHAFVGGFAITPHFIDPTTFTFSPIPTLATSGWLMADGQMAGTLKRWFEQSWVGGQIRWAGMDDESRERMKQGVANLSGGAASPTEGDAKALFDRLPTEGNEYCEEVRAKARKAYRDEDKMCAPLQQRLHEAFGGEDEVVSMLTKDTDDCTRDFLKSWGRTLPELSTPFLPHEVQRDPKNLLPDITGLKGSATSTMHGVFLGFDTDALTPNLLTMDPSSIIDPANAEHLFGQNAHLNVLAGDAEADIKHLKPTEIGYYTLIRWRPKPHLQRPRPVCPAWKATVEAWPSMRNIGRAQSYFHLFGETLNDYLWTEFGKDFDDFLRASASNPNTIWAKTAELTEKALGATDKILNWMKSRTPGVNPWPAVINLTSFLLSP